ECLKTCKQNIEDQLQSLYYSFYSLQDSDSLQKHVNANLIPYLRYDILKDEPNLDAIYTLLCYSGYLTVKFDDELNNKVDKQWMFTKAKLAIPNREVAEQWKMWIIDFIGITRSYEGWYHTFILGALAMYHSDDYQVMSNCESGTSSPDVRIIPVNHKFNTCIIFEFKRAESGDYKEMKDCTQNALDQIVAKNYRLNTASHIEVIVEVAIAFFKKEIFVSAQLLQRKKSGKNGELSTNAWVIVSSDESC
ncbi:20460_t:CDS:2, partial [Racocetra persica]